MKLAYRTDFQPISPTEALFNGPERMKRLQMLANLRVPQVPTRNAATRFARRFKRRMEDGVQGATRFYNRKLGNSFAASSAPQTRSLRVASSFLMAGRSRSMQQVPAVPLMSIIRARIVAQTVRLARAGMGLMAQRFNTFARDWSADKKPDGVLAHSTQVAFGQVAAMRLRYA